jgi:hypothetical protein
VKKKCEHTNCNAKAVVELQGQSLCIPHFDKVLKSTIEGVAKALRTLKTKGEYFPPKLKRRGEK